MENKPDKPKFPFTPVPLRARHDGWTTARQIAFIEALAETGLVEEACRRVGMSDTSAYNLRFRAHAASFRTAWEAASDYALHLLEQDTFVRSRKGVARPIFYKGEQVGEWRHFDERLTMFLLRSRRPQRYGKWTERILPPEDEEPGEDPATRLEDGIGRIEWDAGADEDDGADENDGDTDGEVGGGGELKRP